MALAVSRGLSACAAAPRTAAHVASNGGPARVAPGGVLPRHGRVAQPDTSNPRTPADDEQETLAAIAFAMQALAAPAHGCWAVAAANDGYELAGELSVRIDIARASHATATLVTDTARSARLASCMTELIQAFAWPSPLVGQTIQLPFRFVAPLRQSVIDRRMVAPTQGVSVWIDERNTGFAAGSLLGVALPANGTTGLRRAERAELWHFASAGVVRTQSGETIVAAGDVMHVPIGAAREIRSNGTPLHAVLAIWPGQTEGAARSGALPTPLVEVTVSGRVVDTRTCVGCRVAFGRAAAAAPPLPQPWGTAVVAYDHVALVEPAVARGAANKTASRNMHRQRITRVAVAETLLGAAAPQPVGVPFAVTAAVLDIRVLAQRELAIAAPGPQLWFIHEGTGTLQTEGVRVPLGPHSVVAILPSQAYLLHTDAAMRITQFNLPAIREK